MNDDISRAIAMFRSSPNLGDEELFETLVNQGMKRELAARLVEFLPMAYCRLMLRDSGVRFSNTFWRVRANGESREEPLSSEPVWLAVVSFASTEAECGISGNDLLLVASHSAEFHAANQLLNKGSNLENLVLTSAVLTWSEDGPQVPHRPGGSARNL